MSQRTSTSSIVTRPPSDVLYGITRTDTRDSLILRDPVVIVNPYDVKKTKVFFDGRCRIGLGFNAANFALACWTLGYLIYALVQRDFVAYEVTIAAMILVLCTNIINFAMYFTERISFYYFDLPAYMAHWVSIIIFIWMIVTNILLSFLLFFFERAAPPTAYIIVIAASLLFLGIAFTEGVLIYWLLRDYCGRREQRKWHEQAIEEARLAVGSEANDSNTATNNDDISTTQYYAAKD